MSDFEFVTNPDGTRTLKYVGKFVSEKPKPETQNAFVRNVPLLSNVQSSYEALGEGIREYQRSGDLRKSLIAGQQAYAEDIKGEGFGRSIQRVVYGGGRNLIQGLANLQRPEASVGEGDMPIPGLGVPLPKVEGQNWAEGLGQDLLTTAVAWIPASRLLSLGLKGATMVPGVLQATQRVAPLLQAAKTSVTSQPAVQAQLAKTVPLLQKPVSEVLKKGAQIYTEGAATGAVVDLLAFSPQAQVAEQAAEEFVTKNEGFFPNGLLREYVLVQSSDTQLEGRIKQALQGALITGPAFGFTVEGARFLVPKLLRKMRADVNFARQQAAAQEAVQAKPAPEAPAAPVAPEPVKGAQAQADLARLQAREPRPFETPGVVIQEDLPPANREQLIAAAKEVVDAQADVDRAVARVQRTVPDALGPADAVQSPTAIPTFSQVREVSPNTIVARPQEMQYKAEGQRNKFGTSGSLTKAQVFDENLAGLITVWRDPANGELVVVNGHNRLRLAQLKGAEAVNIREISAANAQEARTVGALQNIAEGQGTAWDAAKLMRDMSFSPGALQEKGIDLGGRIARDAVPLARLPQEIFEKGATGGLSLEKAVALGSVEGLDDAVIRDVAARAAKGKFSADKIAQAMQEARFATTQGPEGGVLPGMEDLFKTSNFDQLLNVRTEAYRALREQMVALSSAANLKRTGILEAAGNVIDVAGSRAAKDQAAAALNLFNQVTGYVGPVRDLLTEMAGLVKGGVSAKKVVAENLDRLRNAIEAEVNGTRLPLEPEPTPTRQLTPEQERTLLGSEARVQALQELDPQRLAQERQQAVKTLEIQERQTAERLSTAAQQVSPQAVADAERYGLNPRYVQKWMDLPPTALAVEMRQLAGYELTQRQYTNRVQRLQAMEANDAAVAQYLDEMPGSNSARELTEEEFATKYGDTQPVLTPKVELNRVTRELDRHDLAVAAIDWFNDWNARPKAEVKPQAVAETPVEKIQAREEAEDLVATAMDTLLPEQRAEAEDLIRRALGGKVTPEQRAALEGAQPDFVIDDRANAERMARMLGGQNNNRGWLRIKEQQWLDAFKRLGGVPDWFKFVGGKENWERMMQGYEMPELEAKVKNLILGAPAPTPARAATPAFTLPEGLSKAAPRYGYGQKQFTLRFASDLDRTAYVLANDVKTRSKAAGKFEEAVAAAGLDLPAIRSHGDQVRSYIKGLAKDASPGQLDIPDQGFGGREAPLASEAPAGWGSVGPVREGLGGLKAAVIKSEQNIARETVVAMRRELDRWTAANPEPVGDAAARLRWIKERSSRVQDVIDAGDIMLQALKAPVGEGRVIIPERYGFQWAQLSPDVRKGIGQTIGEDLRRMLGDEIGLRFEDGFFLHPKAEAWGGTGNPNDLSFANGVFDPFENLITLYNMRYVMGGVNRKISTAWHEAFHAIQYNFLTLQELRSLNGWFAQIRLGKSKRADAKGLLEQQATSYERYVYARENDLPVAAFMLKMDEKLLKGTNLSPERKAMVDAAAGIIEVFDRLTDFVEKVGNFLSTRGWTSTRQLFEDAYTGRLAQRGPLGNALEEGGQRARVLRAAKRKGEIGFIEGRLGGLASEMEPPQPPGSRTPDLGDNDPTWQERWAQVMRDNREKLESGEVTMEDLYAANKFAKPRSPSGSQIYTNDHENLVEGLSAMSAVSPSRAEMTGIPVFDPQQIRRFNQQWFDRHAMDSTAAMRGLDKLAGGFAEYEQGALNRAMDYADKLQVRAQEEAAIWLNSANDPSIDRQEQLARLIVAADSARRMHVAIANVTRPWGQLGVEMQMPRDYTYGIGGAPAPDVPVAAVTGQQQQNIVETALRRELEVAADAKPVLDETLSKLPELREAIETGEMTVGAEAAADEIASTLMVAGDRPAMRLKTYGTWRALPASNEGPENPLNALQILRSSNLLSSGVTVSKNLFNGIFNLSRLTLAQSLGGALEGDMERALYSMQMFGSYFNNVGNALRAAATAFRTGQQSFNVDVSTLDFMERVAAREAQSELMGTAGEGWTGYSLNTLDMSQQFAESKAGQFANALWQVLGTSGGRMAITIDAFNSSLAGYSYEFFRHMPRGMELAEQSGLVKYSKEAFNYAYQYAEKRVDQAIVDVTINGETLADMAMKSPHAQKFMDAVNFTDKISVELEPRTLDEGMRLGKLRNLSGQELNDFARQYVEVGQWRHRAANALLNGPIPLGRTASIPGEVLTGLSEMRLIGPVFRFVQPFQRVPANIIKSAARNTPAAPLVDTWLRDITSSDAGTRQRALGEFAMGTGVLTALWAASNLGRVRFNGGGPLDPTQRERWTRERQMAYSVQFWDEENMAWGAPHSMAQFEPFATILGGLADYSDTAAMMTTEQRDQAGASLVLDLVKLQASGLLGKTYFQGITELYEAAFDPSKVFTGPNKRSAESRFLQRVIASMVPWSSALRQARRAVDPVKRAIEPSADGGLGGFWQETWSEIKNALPGMSESNPPKLDWTLPGAPPIYGPGIFLSQQLAEEAPFLAAGLQFVPLLSAFSTGRQELDPVQLEMSTMHGKGTAFAGPRASDFGAQQYLTPTELNQYIKLFATVTDDSGLTWHGSVSRLINSPTYLSLPIEAPSNQRVSHRAALFQIEISKFKELAKEQFLKTTAKGAEIMERDMQLRRHQDELINIRRYAQTGAIPPEQSGQAQNGPAQFVQELNR